MFTAAPAILSHINAILAEPLQAAVPGIKLNNDEPLNLVYEDLPSLATYPIKEDFNFDESFASSDKKQLALRIELRMKGGPASSVCTPIINLIAATIRADRTLGGLADYVELQTTQWANDEVAKGQVCGASLDVQVNYLT